MKSFDIPRRNKQNCKKTIDLTGREFGKLKVVSFCDKKGNSTRWNCLCSCGKYTKSSTSNLIHNGVSACRSCSNKCAQKYEEIYYEFIYRIKKNAKTRGYEFNVSMEYLWELFLKQERKCVISGLPITMGNKRNEWGTASLDRIDNNLGYIEGNVQWLHKDINRMKWAHGQQYFIKLCKSVADYNEEE
jgi:hypothetical protein